MEHAGIQLVSYGNAEKHFFGEEYEKLYARDIEKLANCNGKNMEQEVVHIGDMIANFIFEVEFEEGMSEKEFYENVENFSLKIGEKIIWEISGNYFWRNCCIKRQKILGERRKWFLVVKMKELMLGDSITSNFNLIALKNFPLIVSLQLRKNAEIIFYVDYLFYWDNVRRKLCEKYYNFQMIIPKIIREEIKDGKIILPTVNKLFANCFWIQLPKSFADVTINGEPIIQDHYGEGLYWVEWKDGYVDGIMSIPLEGVVTIFFDELRDAGISDGLISI